MLKLLKPEEDGYVGAALDEEGNPIKVVCDVLEVSHYVLDVDTSPMMTLTATYARFDSKNNYLRAGPVTQHLITGEELAGILEQPGGVTIKAIDESTAKTGIPSAGIEAEDLIYDTALPTWRTEYWVAKIRETVKRLEEERLRPAPPPSMPMPPPLEPTP